MSPVRNPESCSLAGSDFGVSLAAQLAAVSQADVSPEVFYGTFIANVCGQMQAACGNAAALTILDAVRAALVKTAAARAH